MFGCWTAFKPPCTAPVKVSLPFPNVLSLKCAHWCSQGIWALHCEQEEPGFVDCTCLLFGQRGWASFHSCPWPLLPLIPCTGSVTQATSLCPSVPSGIMRSHCLWRSSVILLWSLCLSLQDTSQAPKSPLQMAFQTVSEGTVRNHCTGATW